jgi:hypothetical protein
MAGWSDGPGFGWFGPEGTGPDGACPEDACPERTGPDGANLEGTSPDGANLEGTSPEGTCPDAPWPASALAGAACPEPEGSFAAAACRAASRAARATCRYTGPSGSPAWPAIRLAFTADCAPPVDCSAITDGACGGTGSGLLAPAAISLACWPVIVACTGPMQSCLLSSAASCSASFAARPNTTRG